MTIFLVVLACGLLALAGLAVIVACAWRAWRSFLELARTASQAASDLGDFGVLEPTVIRDPRAPALAEGRAGVREARRIRDDIAARRAHACKGRAHRAISRWRAIGIIREDAS
ncbi:MAG: hypothetical protein Q4B10_05285 [Actinomycetaceae bacterium]|nr:hypothetical protein [Actinomycetaceae bacterium]